MNIVLLHGVLAREPELRELPSGDHVASFDKLEPGGELIVTGRVRRRFFRAGGATQSRTEVVATAVVLTRQAKSVDKAIAAALATGDEWLPL